MIIIFEKSLFELFIIEIFISLSTPGTNPILSCLFMLTFLVKLLPVFRKSSLIREKFLSSSVNDLLITLTFLERRASKTVRKESMFPSS